MTQTCKIPTPVAEWIDLVENGEHPSSKEIYALAKHLRRVFETEELRFEKERYEKYIGLSKYYPFELLPWEKCQIALWLCVYKNDFPRWRTLFDLIGRGAGKDGFISFISFCLTSPFNPVLSYDVDICANNEDQAMLPVLDLVEVLETPRSKAKLDKHFYHTKEIVQGRKNRGKIRGRTNNPSGKDGMRSGAIIFNEVHQYQNYDNITVFKTGLGKKADARIGIFTSDGEVTDGPLDSYKERANRILFESEEDGGFLPFVFHLDNESDVNDESNWYKANPSLAYMPNLLQETRDEFAEYKKHPEENITFLTRRMGIRKGRKDIAVTDYEKVQKTKKPLPNLGRKPCTVGVDYAELNDWASVNLHFRIGDKRYDINHSWICLQSRDLHRIKPPWRTWADEGSVTLVDDVSISPDLLAAYIHEAAKKYSIKMLAMDHFRWTLVSEAFIKIGFDAKDKSKVKLVRPSDIMMTDPIIQDCFDRELFYWGEETAAPLRWGVSNTKRIMSSKKIGVATGNFIYAKIEPKSRKTDPFMALVASMTIEDVLVQKTYTPRKVGAIAI